MALAKKGSNMMQLQKVVIPAKAGIHGLCNKLKFPDSRFHGNDEKMQLETFCERIKYGSMKNPRNRANFIAEIARFRRNFSI